MAGGIMVSQLAITLAAWVVLMATSLTLFGLFELLPVLRTPSLGDLMEPEVDDGTTEFYARVQA
ncbi:MAG: hypothetical protein ACREXS_11865 [Gammaproteobacteria bacterium]